MRISTYLLDAIADMDIIANAHALTPVRVKDNVREVSVIPAHVTEQRGMHDYKDVPNLVILKTQPGFFDAFATQPRTVMLLRNVTLVIREQPYPVRFAFVDGTVIYSVQREA